VAALPSEVLRFALQLDPEALRTSAADLRATATRFTDLPAHLTSDLTWEGPAAESFAATWTPLTAHIGTSTDPATLTGRLESTAAYTEAMATWAETFRHEVAEAIARVATSSEAVTLLTTPQPAAPPPSDGEPKTPAPTTPAATAAAARIATRVLQTAADGLDSANAMEYRWVAPLSELDYRRPEAAPATSTTSVTRVNL
jgi:hypothetical protein